MAARTHGMSKTRFYGVWNDMMMRCYNPNKERYQRYGGRGIKVSKRWRTFDNFYKDMFHTYRLGLSLERKKVNGNYCKSNCKWIPLEDQYKNRCNSIYLTIDGKKMSAADWIRQIGATWATVYMRLKKGYSDKDALFGRGERIKLTDSDKDTIKKLKSTGMSFRKIGIQIGRSHSTITNWYFNRR